MRGGPSADAELLHNSELWMSMDDGKATACPVEEVLAAAVKVRLDIRPECSRSNTETGGPPSASASLKLFWQLVKRGHV